MSPNEALDNLIHDVNSKCASLKAAAKILCNASPKEKDELLALMLEEARSLAKNMEAFLVEGRT